MNIEEFLKDFRSHMIIKEDEDWAIIGVPFFHWGYSEGIAIRINYKNGVLSLSDCHSTIDYLEDEQQINLDDYRDKLSAIMSRFDIYLDGNVFRKVIHHADLCTLHRGLGYFIEAICLIAHIDL